VRSDGHSVEGVDVPYAFDGGLTGTVSDDTTVGFTLVRNQAKMEAPLAALATNPIVLSTIARVTFYGHDQTGREVSRIVCEPERETIGRALVWRRCCDQVESVAF
jgi:hypothetical protein